jgi:flagellar protein FliO/FliZ
MESVDPSRFVFASAVVLALLATMALVLKRMVASGTWLKATNASQAARLHVVETRYIDARRKLVLVKRDHTEYLLLLADSRETVLESGIPSEPPHA